MDDPHKASLAVIRVHFINYENNACAHITMPGLKAIMLVLNEATNHQIGRYIFEWPSADEMSDIWDDMVEKSKQKKEPR